MAVVIKQTSDGHCTRAWQETVLEELFSKHTVLWIADRLGVCGKDWLKHYIVEHFCADVFNFNMLSDIECTQSETVLFDLEESKHINNDVIEYCMRRGMSVIVFAKCEPQFPAFWKRRDIDDVMAAYAGDTPISAAQLDIIEFWIMQNVPLPILLRDENGNILDHTFLFDIPI